MSVWVEQEFAERILCNYGQFRKVSINPFKLNCRCPVCGDSATDEFKARFWAYEYQGSIMVHCYNCDVSMGIRTFIKEYDEPMYREMLLEISKSNGFNRPKVQSVIIKKAAPVIEQIPYSVRLDTLPKNHPIIKYVQGRKIPEYQWNRLYFTGEWPKLCNHVKPGTYKKEPKEYRLVIPIYNADGKMESFQGRALTPDAPQKYITIKSSDDATKIYGVDRIDPSQTVITLEGPLDSLFIKNAIAITGGSLDLDSVPFKGNRVWAMDHEPRHPDTIKRMERLIEAGEKVCFWLNCPWNEKDINEMIKEGAKPDELRQFILDNSYSGNMARLKLKQYRKV